MKHLSLTITGGILLSVLFVLFGRHMQALLGTDTLSFPFLTLQITHNHGFAWGVSSPLPVVILLGALATLILCTLYLRSTHRTVFSSFAFGLLFGGAFANMFERITFGFVTDYLHLPFLSFIPNFNLADMSLTFGALVLILYSNRIFR